MAAVRSQLRRWLLVAALIALVVAPAGHAHAEPTLAEVEAQIDAAWRELEPLIEEYNRVRSELKDNEKESEQLAEEMAPLELKLSIAMAELDEIVVRQYMGGGMSAFNSLLTSGSPTTFVDRLALLDHVARDQQQQIAQAAAAQAEFEQQKQEVDALIAAQQEQEADLAARTERIEEELERLEELRRQAQARQQAQQAQQPSASAPTGSCPAVAGSGPGALAAEFACAQLGKPYQWGASGPGSFDCSGLTQAAWASAGVSLTHYTGSQWNQGRAVGRSELIPGDLVFFHSDLSHVGLYIGNGTMVHAPRAGDVVRMASIDVMPIAGFRRPG